MSYIISNPARYLVSAEQGSGTGLPMDTRAAPGLAYIVISTYAASAIYSIQASHDLTAWMPVATYTATTTTATAQQSGYYPYIRANINNLYSGGGNTGSGLLFYHPIV